MTTQAQKKAIAEKKAETAEAQSPKQIEIAWGWKLGYVLGSSALLALAIFLAAKYDRPAQYLAGALGIIAISTFVMFYINSREVDTRMRTAIAGAVVVTFLLYFALVVFSPSLQDASRGAYKDTSSEAAEGASARTGNQATPGNNDAGKKDANAKQSSSISDTVPTNLFQTFAWVTITVVGFYFGGRTVEKLVGK